MTALSKTGTPLVYLPSVGTYIDPADAVTYPANNDGTADLNAPVQIAHVSNEWIKALSKEDYLKVVGL